MSEPNSIFKTGWMAVVLVGAVLLLFCAWLFLKVYRNEPRTVLKKKEVQQQQATGNQQDSQPEDEGTKTNTKKPDLQESREKKEQTGQEDLKANPDTATTSTPSEEKEIERSTEDEDKTDQKNGTSKKQETDTVDKTASRNENDEQEQTNDASGQDDQVQKGADPDPSGAQSSEQQMAQVDQEKLTEAKDLYDSKSYKKAIQRLNDILNKLDDGKRAQELQELKSSWTSEYKQRQKLAEQWISKAETAAEQSDWSTVIEHAKNAQDHVPGVEQAERLIKRANEMKAYQGMVKIPQGTYSYLEDGTQVQTFYIDRQEVTNAEYKSFMEETGHKAPMGWDDRTVPVGREDHPVSGISYEDARAYASWAGKKLPTERQWEVAARGSSGRTYPWGQLDTNGGSPAANTVEMGVGGSISVDELSESCTPKEVCHLVGNVAEWTRTTETSETGEPLQVVKGGSYLYPIEMGKPSERLLRAADVRLKAIGFRCVKGPK